MKYTVSTVSTKKLPRKYICGGDSPPPLPKTAVLTRHGDPNKAIVLAVVTAAAIHPSNENMVANRSFVGKVTV